MKDSLALLILAISFGFLVPTVLLADWVRRSKDMPPAAGAEPVRDGIASWYGAEYAGRPMANGQPFDPQALTCAAWDWPLGTRLIVWSQATGNGVVVTVTDRGPARRLWSRGRIVDLSQRAFAHLADLDRGLVAVRVEVLAGGAR